MSATPSPIPPAAPLTSGSGAAPRLAPLVRAFHVYANWLVSISWKRFIVLSILLLIVAGILSETPPFTWTISERVENVPTRVVITPKPPRPPPAEGAKTDGAPPRDEPFIKIERPKTGDKEAVEITIGEHGVRISPQKAPAAASAAEAAASAAEAAAKAERAARDIAEQGISITVPAGASEDVRRAIEQAKQDVRDAVQEARRDAEQARRDAEEAVRDAEDAIKELQAGGTRKRIVRSTLGESLPNLAFLWIIASAILKASYKRQLAAQEQAAQATEVAESEQLKRQVVEARMAAMQAQVEPHFLFNTLASIDHLIETDPARASQMQKNLIALLRASMPTMRETASNGAPRDLAREMAVIRPYLEILKVRMEERLSTRIEVPEGLLSAEFPPMMIQSLVENAIKHGLEPKPEGGQLLIKAEIVHGKLNVVVADTGLGFGKAATAGTGVGLANVRERLQLLYGTEASLTVTENHPSGTVVTISVPYRSVAAPTTARA
jgi:signal transduction histidine kinase